MSNTFRISAILYLCSIKTVEGFQVTTNNKTTKSAQTKPLTKLT